MYDFRKVDNGAIVYSTRGIAAIITKTADGYGYTDSEGHHAEGYATCLQCLKAVIIGLCMETIVPIE